MASTKTPNVREAIVLSILMNGEKYGRDIRDLYEAKTKQSFPLGSLYPTLDRMEEKGYVRSRDGESIHERGGNRRKYYKITGEGINSLKCFQIAMTSEGVFANG